MNAFIDKQKYYNDPLFYLEHSKSDILNKFNQEVHKTFIKSYKKLNHLFPLK